jgi:hypothetical protein
MKQVLRSFKPLAFPFIRSAFPGIQRPRPKSRFVRASFDPMAGPQAAASAERPAEAKPALAPASPSAGSQAGRGLLTAPMPEPTAARFDVAEVAKGGCVHGCLPATAGGHQISHSETFANSLSLNDPPNIDRPSINRALQSAMEVPSHQHVATKISPLEVS